MSLRAASVAMRLALFGLTLLVCTTAGAEERPLPPDQPSILLIVLDTVRADAVSAYGKVDGTTPAFDELASEGIRYDRAYSAAPWTLPSHATIFTGRRIDEHRMSLPGQPDLPIDFETLAEALHEAGYETAAFSENALVSDVFGLLRGFDHREATFVEGTNTEVILDARTSFLNWIATRDSSRPFFAFVNIMDAHRPYEVRAENPWVPKEATKWDVSDRSAWPERLLCGGLPTPLQIEILRGLYHGDVHAADQKLGQILEAARAALGDRPLITVATSDHGEHFGENMLLDHKFSVHSALLRVPLVVHGVVAKKAIVVEPPVGLEDLMPSILSWAGVDAPGGLAGVPLPVSAESSEPAQPRSFFAAYSDATTRFPEGWADILKPSDLDRARQFCTDSNRVFGAMASLIRYPFKYVWYERYPASLYDLSWDPGEKSDQAPLRPDLIESFEAEMKPLREATDLQRDSGSGLSKEAIETLKKLGYVE